MTDQRKSPALGQGLEYSHGGESLDYLCREILEKSNGGRVKCAQPLLWQWTNNPMPLQLLAGDHEFRIGQPIHPFMIAASGLFRQ